MRLYPNVETAEELDNQLGSDDLVRALEPPYGAWVRGVRLITGVAAIDLAKKLGISQAAVTKLEQREETRAISLAKLEMIAQALGCELVYGFVPKKPFAETAAKLEHTQNQARRSHRKIPRPI